MKIHEKFMKNLVVIVIALGIGFLLASQFRSFTRVEQAFYRDRNPNIFREIQILKGVTDRLRKEKAELEARKITRGEPKAYRLMSGEVPVTGPGIRLVISKAIDVAWFTDLTNELVTADAEAIAINNERIGPGQIGFRLIDGKTLLLGDRVLRPPFRFEAIGEKEVLKETLLQPGGTLSRLEKTLKNIEITLSEEESLLFQKIP